LEGIPTLLVDVDPQGNASSWFLTGDLEYELSDVLQGLCYVDDAIVEVPNVKNLFVLPTFGIGGGLKTYAETKIAEEPYVLQDLVQELKQKFDRIILDLPPGLGKPKFCTYK